MTVYGPNNGYVPFTGFSPTLGPSDAVVPVTSGQVQFNGMTQADSEIARELFTKGRRVLRRLMLTLTGAASGQFASETTTRVQAQQATFSPTDYGGLVPVETISLIGRNSTNADVGNIQAVLTRSPVPVYVADVAGIGGGGNLGF
jgi:hypothetical protein